MTSVSSQHARNLTSRRWFAPIVWFAVAFATAALTTGCMVGDEDEVTLDDLLGRNGNGNGAPAGGHYSLNLIGVPKGKTADMTGDDGHRIFVPRDGNTKINLSEGPFEVLDANGTDGSAGFQLPSPDPDNDGLTSYSVFARALGKPGGSSTTTTCATDPSDGELVCSLESMVLVRSTGKSSFTNVSKQLLYVYADLDGDGTVERYPLFDSSLEDYFWEYDNQGLHLAQLRFYEIVTNVN
jgi:hypothetical protein